VKRKAKKGRKIQFLLLSAYNYTTAPPITTIRTGFPPSQQGISAYIGALDRFEGAAGGVEGHGCDSA
jgi:hypothetical protein